MGHGGPPIDCCKSRLESFVCSGVCKTGRGGVKQQRGNVTMALTSLDSKDSNVFTGYLGARSSRPIIFAKGEERRRLNYNSNTATPSLSRLREKRTREVKYDRRKE